MHTTRKGFTLLELLIVIGILAILATATVLVLNPAEYLRQARDTQRVTDLESLKGALSLWVTSGVGTSSLGSCPVNGRCTFNNSTFFTAGTCSGVGQYVTSTAVDGTGWVDVVFNSLPGGSPLPKLPLDPLNNSTSTAYAYKCDNASSVFEIDGTFESAKYKTTDDLDGKDGGNQTWAYEVGTKLDW